MYCQIERVRSWDYLNSPNQAYEAAGMFGQFQRSLTDLPNPKLNETIPDFHNTPKRLRDFLEILDKDPCNHANQAKDEIHFVIKHSLICEGLLELVQKGLIPERTTHNDTKINNILFDIGTGKGICVIDLDTVMPGLSLYDFGDMVRTATRQAAEDEQDLSKIPFWTLTTTWPSGRCGWWRWAAKTRCLPAVKPGPNVRPSFTA